MRAELIAERDRLTEYRSTFGNFEGKIVALNEKIAELESEIKDA